MGWDCGFAKALIQNWTNSYTVWYIEAMSRFAYPVQAIAADEATFNTVFREAMNGRFCTGVMRVTSGSEYDYLLLKRENDQRIVAAAKLMTFEADINVRYLATAEDAKGFGYGRRLFAELFTYAAGRRNTLVLSSYTSFGKEYLWPLEERLARRHYPQLEVVHEMWC
ncbi:MAG TPA: hypothetical protein VIN59_08175 [Alphaproteobacteria bacterium]